MISTIKIPTTMSNVQLMLYNKQLVIIGSHYSQQPTTQTAIIDTSSTTVVALYDMISLTRPKLVKHYKAPGYYQDVRLNGTQLTVVSNLGLNLWNLSANLAAISADSLMPIR